MKVKHEFPPNIAEIQKVFDLRGFNPVFTYGDTLYNPAGYNIPQDLMIHEEVHEKQQFAIGKEQWWELYLRDQDFRLSQEVEAYKEQYKFLKTVLNRKGRLAALNVLAENLSSKLYGQIINKKKAKELIDG